MTTILIADDASFMRNSLKFLVEGAGHEVTGLAKDGEEAVEMYKRLKPELVMLDILMEGMNGLAALKTIMQEDPKARVIMVSALGQEAKQQEAQRLGARGFVKKPFSQETILGELQRVLAEEEMAQP